MEKSKLVKQFDNMTEQQQYDWLVNVQPKNDFTIYLDNDDTHIYYHDDTEADYCLRFKGFLSNGPGVELLLKSLGYNAESV